MLSISWNPKHVYWAPGATVPHHTCTGTMPMCEAWRTTRVAAACVYTHKHGLSTSNSRGKSTGGLNWESAPWKHGILDANKLITAGGEGPRVPRPHEKKKTWNLRVWPTRSSRGVAEAARTSGCGRAYVWCGTTARSRSSKQETNHIPFEVREKRQLQLAHPSESPTGIPIPVSGNQVSDTGMYEHWCQEMN